jgi:hypothetical protein
MRYTQTRANCILNSLPTLGAKRHLPNFVAFFPTNTKFVSLPKFLSMEVRGKFSTQVQLQNFSWGKAAPASYAYATSGILSNPQMSMSDSCSLPRRTSWSDSV